MSLKFPKRTVQKTFFFCRFNDKSSLIATNIVRSLIRQCLPDAESLPQDVEDSLTKVLRDTIVRVEDLSRLLELAIASSTEHYIVIDGVDECIEPERRTLFKMLSDAVRSSSSVPVKLLVSSRYRIPEGLRRISGCVSEVLVDEEKSKPDMETYIETTLATRLDDGSFKVGDPTLAIHIRNALIARAQGMYVNFPIFIVL